MHYALFFTQKRSAHILLPQLHSFLAFQLPSLIASQLPSLIAFQPPIRPHSQIEFYVKYNFLPYKFIRSSHLIGIAQGFFVR